LSIGKHILLRKNQGMLVAGEFTTVNSFLR
jgi:hypothetical protein